MVPPPNEFDLLRYALGDPSLCPQNWPLKGRMVEALTKLPWRDSEFESAITIASLYIDAGEDPRGPLQGAFGTGDPRNGNIPNWNELDVNYVRQLGEDFRKRKLVASSTPTVDLPKLQADFAAPTASMIDDQLRDRLQRALNVFDRRFAQVDAMLSVADRYISLTESQIGTMPPRWNEKKLARMRQLAETFRTGQRGERIPKPALSIIDKLRKFRLWR